jgi:hypothetical protein
MITMNLRSDRKNERGAALVIAILVLAILTVIGIALMLITSTETRIAANEWSVNRGFYASDAGIRWGTAQMNLDLPTFLGRPEFGTKASPNFVGTVLFNMPSNRFATGSGFLPGDGVLGSGNDIQVRVTNPGRLSRRLCFGCKGNAPGDQAQFLYNFEVRATGSQDDSFLQYSKALVADVEAGPLPGQLPF